MNKTELINLAKELLELDNLNNRKEDLLYLKKQYKYLSTRDEDSYYEQQKTDEFNALFLKLAEKEPSLLVSSYDEKKAIIAEARKLLERSDILKANKELDKLSEEFKNAGRCSKEQDDELYAEFKEVKDRFYAKKKAYFEELDKSNAEKKEKKKALIAEGQEVLKSENFKEANDKINELLKQWKAIGYCGKEDQVLWEEFSQVLSELRDKRKEHHQEMLKLFEKRAEKKEALIKKAKMILANSEFTDEEIEKVKNLRKEFASIGFAGKEKDDDLYARFNEVINKYFEELKFYR